MFRLKSTFSSSVLWGGAHPATSSKDPPLRLAAELRADPGRLINQTRAALACKIAPEPLVLHAALIL